MASAVSPSIQYLLDPYHVIPRNTNKRRAASSLYALQQRYKRWQIKGGVFHVDHEDIEASFSQNLGAHIAPQLSPCS